MLIFSFLVDQIRLYVAHFALDFRKLLIFAAPMLTGTASALED